MSGSTCSSSSRASSLPVCWRAWRLSMVAICAARLLFAAGAAVAAGGDPGPPCHACGNSDLSLHGTMGRDGNSGRGQRALCAELAACAAGGRLSRRRGRGKSGPALLVAFHRGTVLHRLAASDGGHHLAGAPLRTLPEGGVAGKLCPWSSPDHCLPRCWSRAAIRQRPISSPTRACGNWRLAGCWRWRRSPGGGGVAARGHGSDRHRRGRGFGAFAFRPRHHFPVSWRCRRRWERR